MKVEEADRSEVDKIYSIEEEVFPDPRQKSSLIKAIYEADWALQVAKVNSEIVGHALRTGNTLNAIAVRPEHRGNGYGKNLLEAVIGSVPDHYHTLELKVRESNSKAIGLYEDFGFEKEEKVLEFYEDGEDAFRMVKSLYQPQIVKLSKDSWVPYQGPQGGEGWQNTETGDVVYDDEPPGDTDVDPEEYHDADAESLIEAIEAVTGEDLDEWSGLSAEEIREAIQDMASPEQMAEVMEELTGEGEIDYDGDYDVNTEFEAEVARAVDGGEATRITTTQWNVVSDIENETLLVDALKQIEDNGTKTAKKRVRSRLRGLGWDTEEIDKEIREESVEPADRFDKGDEITIDSGGGELEATVLRVDEDSRYGVLNIKYSDGGDAWLDEEDIEEADIEIQGFDVERLMKGFPVPEPGDSNGIPDNIQTIWDKASTEDLQEFVENQTVDPSEVSNPFGEIMDLVSDGSFRVDMTERDNEALNEAEDIISDRDAGLIDSDEAHQRSREIIAEYPEVFDLESRDAKVAKGLLWYRDDRDVGIWDIVDYDVDAGEESYVQDVHAGFSDSLNKVEPYIGAYALASLEEVKVHDRSNRGSDGKHYDVGRIKVGTNNSVSQIKEIAAHEMGHQIHKSMGLHGRYGTYPDSGEWRRFDRDQAVFGIRERDNEVFDDLKKFQKNWERYQSGMTGEVRPYQRRHGVEYLSVSFEKWATDETRLKGRDPHMAHFWDVHAGDAERVESIEELEEGDEIILESGSTFPTAYKVESVGTAVEEEMGGRGTEWWELREIKAGGVADETYDELPQDLLEFFQSGVKYD